MIIDLLVIILCVMAMRRGFAVGFLHQVFGITGFFIGLFAGAFLAPHIVPHINGEANRALASISLTLGPAMVFLLAGEVLGIRTKRKLRRLKINKIDANAGLVLNFFSMLAGVWLVATLLSNLSWQTMQLELQKSHIVSGLNSALPASPNIIDRFGHIINPNGFPKVFVDNEPKQGSSMSMPAPTTLQEAINQDGPSVFKILGQGCGGIVDGSGFMIRPNLIATNAHVVAGVKQSYAENGSGMHKVSVIGFDPELDFALLRTTDIDATPLALSDKIPANKTAAAVLGYPGGGDFNAESAVIASHFVATGADIYGKAHISRSIYDVRGNIVPGNSGGPVITANGQVVGMVFAQSTSYKNTGYALTATSLTRAVNRATSAIKVQDTGSCVE